MRRAGGAATSAWKRQMDHAWGFAKFMAQKSCGCGDLALEASPPLISQPRIRRWRLCLLETNLQGGSSSGNILACWDLHHLLSLRLLWQKLRPPYTSCASCSIGCKITAWWCVKDLNLRVLPPLQLCLQVRRLGGEKGSRSNLKSVLGFIPFEFMA